MAFHLRGEYAGNSHPTAWMGVLVCVLLLLCTAMAEPLDRIFEPTAPGVEAAGAQRLIPPADVDLVKTGPGAATPMKAVSISSSFIRALPQSFIFTLPTGEELVVKRRAGMPTRRSVDGLNIDTWAGHVEGLPLPFSAVTLQVLPSGKLYGTLHYVDAAANQNRNFLIRPNGAGPADSYVLTEFATQQGGAAGEMMPRLSPIDLRLRRRANRRALNATAGAAAAGPAGRLVPADGAPQQPLAVPQQPLGPSTATTGGAAITMDHLVVYTQGALAAKGTADAVLADAVGATDRVNLAYANSGISVQLNTVGVRQVTYTSVDFGTDLNAVTNGNIPNVWQYRNDVGADLVTLIIEDKGTNTAGIAWVIASPNAGGQDQYGYSVVSVLWWNGYLTMAHELGHNLGCMHDRANSGTTSGIFPYSYGLQYPAGNWYTVMAYQCSGCWSPGQIAYFTNPSIAYNGVATGVSQTASNSADNAATIRYSAPYIAAFRASVQPCPAGQKRCSITSACVANTTCCSDIDCASTQTCNVATGVCSCKSGFKSCSAAATGCIATANCCNSTDCSGGQTCPSVGGTCTCADPNTKLCNGTCIPLTSCCADIDCASTQACNVATGVCACKSGFKSCSAAATGCIATATCCNSTDCSGGRTCPSVGGTCSCTDPNTKLCNGTCIPLTSCCADNECLATQYCDTATKTCLTGCRAGNKTCASAAIGCIPTGTCCTSPDCPAAAGGGMTCSGPGGSCSCTTAGTKLCPQIGAAGTCVSSSFCCSGSECPAGYTCPTPLGTAACKKAMYATVWVAISATYSSSSKTYTCALTIKVTTGAGGTGSTVSGALVTGRWTSGTTNTLVSTISSTTTTTSSGLKLTAQGIASSAKSCTATISGITKTGYAIVTTLPIIQTKTWP